MNFYYIFLLLPVVLSVYSESPDPPDPLDLTVVAVCPNSSSDSLGVLAPVLSQNEMSGSVLSQNRVLPQNEVYRTILLPQSEVFGSQNVILPQNEVYKTIVLPQIEVFGSVLPQNEVFRTVLLQNEAFEIDLPQHEVNTSVLLQGGIFRVVIVNWQLSNEVKAVIDFVLNLRVKSIKILTSTLVNGVKKLGWTIRILLESLQHVLKMYTWSLSENQTSVQFRCRLIELLLKRSLFRKHEFPICVYKVYHNYQNLGFWHLKIFSNYKSNSHTHVGEDDSQKSTTFQFYGGGKSLIFSSDELRPYTSDDIHGQQYQFLQCIKKNNKQTLDPNDGNVLCNMPLNVLVPKLTLKSAKELANLHDMYMPSKILLKNAHILLENHKCETCPDLLAIFKPYKTASNAEYQQTWYQKNKEKRAKYKKQLAEKSEYQESNRKYAHKHYWSKKDEKFPPNPPSTDLCQQIVSDFCADPSPEVFEESCCAVF